MVTSWRRCHDVFFGYTNLAQHQPFYGDEKKKRRKNGKRERRKKMREANNERSKDGKKERSKDRKTERGK